MTGLAVTAGDGDGGTIFGLLERGGSGCSNGIAVDALAAGCGEGYIASWDRVGLGEGLSTSSGLDENLEGVADCTELGALEVVLLELGLWLLTGWVDD